MSADRRLARRQVAVSLFLASLSPSLLAQAELGTELVKTGLYLITGGGCNSLLRLSAAGSVLVDGKLPGTYRTLMSQVRRINKLSDLPLRVVVFTNHHDLHAGNQAQFVGAGMAVLAHANALPRLAAAAPPPAAASAVPARKAGAIFGFQTRHDFRFGGVDIQLHHFGPARTDDDIVVLFPDLRVLAIGELYSAIAPVPDYGSGGTLPGWARVLEQVLTLDFDLAIPSTGSPMSRAELVAHKERVQSLTVRATALVKAGVARDQFVQRLSALDPGWTMDLDAESASRLYEDLAGGI